MTPFTNRAPRPVGLSAKRRASGGRTRSARRSAAAMLALALIAPAAIVASRATAASQDLVEIARVAFPPDPNEFSPIRGRLLIDSVSRQGVRLYRNPSTGNLALWALDMDSLADGPRVDEVADFPASPPIKYGFFATAGGGRFFVIDELGWVHAFDQRTLERVGFYPSILPPPSGSSVGVAQREQSQASARQTDDGRRTVAHPLLAAPGHRIVAFEYLPSLGGGGGDELVTLSHGYVNEVDVPLSVLTLHRWDARTGREIATTRLSGCTSGRGFGNETRASTGLALAARPGGGRELIYGCVGRGLLGEVWRAALNPDGTLGAQAMVTTVATAGDFLIDPAGRRAHAITSSGVGQSFVAVDLDRGGVVGAVGLSFDFEAAAAAGGVGAAIDPTTGRLYALAEPSLDDTTGKTNAGGVVVVDGRRSPLPQGFAFTDLAGQAAEMVAVDPGSGARPTRVFVRRLGEPFYRVFADRIPVQPDPTLADADRFTVAAEEQEGVTRASFTGGANGYGMRMLLVGGTNAVPDAITSVRGESLTKDMVTGFVASPGCGPTNREVIAGFVAPTTGLSDTAATAEAIAADADPRTIQDLAEPVASCSPAVLSRTTLGRSRTHPDDFTLGTNAWKDTDVPGSDDNIDQVVGPSWPFSTAVCLPPARPEDRSPKDGDGPYDGVPPPTGYTAGVVCDIGAQTLSADAVATAVDLGGVAAERAETRVEIEREANEGVTVTVESLVRGVAIADVVTIERARAVATAVAAGRPGTAAGTFMSEMCGLRFPGVNVEHCFDPRDPDYRQIMAGLNQVLAQRQMEIRLPSPDDELQTGTPGGALAAVQKDRFAVQGERLFNNDFLVAVPAFELLRVHDSTQGRGRQIVQVAGVQASTAYNISVVPTGSAGGPTASLPDLRGSGVLGDGFSATGGGGSGALPRVEDAGGRFPGPGTMLATIASTISYVVRYALRSPGKALSVAALLFVAFALPLHLLERRRTFAEALAKRS